MDTVRYPEEETALASLVTGVIVTSLLIGTIVLIVLTEMLPGGDVDLSGPSGDARRASLVQAPVGIVLFAVPLLVAGVGTAWWRRGRDVEQREAAARSLTAGAGVLLYAALPLFLLMLWRALSSTDPRTAAWPATVVLGAVMVAGVLTLLLRRQPVARVVVTGAVVGTGVVVHVAEPIGVVFTPYTGAVAGLLVGAVVLSPRRRRAMSAREPAGAS